MVAVTVQTDDVVAVVVGKTADCSSQKLRGLLRVVCKICIKMK